MLKKYPALWRTAWAQMLEFRAEIILWMMSSMLTLIMLVVWLSVAEDNNGSVNGFTANDFITYFVIGWAMRNVTAVWASWELDSSIREGRLSPTLLRPMHPVHMDIIQNLAEKGLRFIIVLPVVTAVAIVGPGLRIDTSPITWLYFIVSLVGTWWVLFWSDYIVGILAFWTSQVQAFILTWYGIRLVLTGIIAPLVMFPVEIQKALLWLPFRYMNSFSVEILTARVAGYDMWFGFAVQFAWCVFFFVAFRLMWKVAIRNYSAVGA